MSGRILSKKDILLIAVIVITGAALWGIWNWINTPDADADIYAEITTEFGVYNAALDRNRTFSVYGLPEIVFEVRDGQIAFIKSNCPDRICINTGFLGRAGQVAACLPNNVLMFLVTEGDSSGHDVDIVVR